MASQIAIAALKAGQVSWKEYFINNVEQDVHNNHVDVNGRKLINLTQSDLSQLDFTGYKFENVDFTKTNLNGCIFKHVSFIQCILNECSIEKTNFSGSTFKGCQLNQCKSFKTNFENVQAEGQRFHTLFEQANFKKANFSGCDMQDASFLNADLRGCNLRRTHLSRTSWQGALLDSKTNFELTNFENHPITRDKSDLIRYSKLFLLDWIIRYFFTWASIRSLGNLPIFGFSWILFLGCITSVNLIAFLNTITPPLIKGLKEIPVPDQIELTILSTSLLVIGTTCYKLFCPQKVREFSEASWVYEHKHPRQEYLSASLQRPIRQKIAVLSFLVGGGIGIFLVVFPKLFSALKYIFVS